MLVACFLDITSFQAFACFRYFIGSVGSEDVCSGVGRLLPRPAAPGPQVGDGDISGGDGDSDGGIVEVEISIEIAIVIYSSKLKTKILSASSWSSWSWRTLWPTLYTLR